MTNQAAKIISVARRRSVRLPRITKNATRASTTAAGISQLICPPVALSNILRMPVEPHIPPVVVPPAPAPPPPPVTLPVSAPVRRPKPL